LPRLQAIHRLNEFKIFNGKRPPQDLLDQLREAIGKKFPMRRGVIKQALQEAIREWIDNHGN
jgi:hypothetical protein